MAMAKSHVDPVCNGTLVQAGAKSVTRQISNDALRRWLLDPKTLLVKWKTSKGKVFCCKIDCSNSPRKSTSRTVKIDFVHINGQPYIGITVDVNKRKVIVNTDI